MTISIKDFDNQEVSIWLVAIGLGSHIKAFRDNAVDGDLLTSLSLDDLTGDLGLSGLQAKKVIRTIEAETHSGSNDGGSSHAEEIAHLERENAQLKGEIADIKARIQRSQGSQAPPAPAPVAHAPAPSPPPQQHHQQQSRGPGVVGGAARGALGGAAKGAIAGAILPGMSAADGAAAGAAVGAATGGARGLRGRLRR